MDATVAAAEAGSDHLPVMLGETLATLAPAAGECVVDLTAGRGGHAGWLARSVGPNGTLVLADLDVTNLAFSADRAREQLPEARVITFHGPFDAVPAELRRLDLRADAVLADLGFASNQMDDPDRGMSFSQDGPLDMRLDRTQGETAAELILHTAEEDLARMIIDDGEEPLGRKIAGRIVAARDVAPIATTGQLAEIVVDAYGARAHTSRVHPATRTFMALRIAVNRELDALDGLLSQVASGAAAVAGEDGDRPRDPAGPEAAGAPSFLGRTPDATADPEASSEFLARRAWLAPGARVAIISFHSLEDRAVKRAFRELGSTNLGEVRTRKPMIASEAEVRTNPRARSAKLRVVAIECVMD